MTGLFVVLHFIDDLVMELLEIAHQCQGNLLVFVGVGGTYQESCPLGVLELSTLLKLTSI